MNNTIIAYPPVGYVSQHVGKIGGRIEVHGVVRQITGIQKTVYIIHDEHGNVFIRGCNPYQTPNRRVPALVHFEATVLGYTEHRGVKRTQVSPGRAYVVDDDHWARRK